MSRRSSIVSFFRRHAPIAMPALFVATVLRAWLMPGLIIGNDAYRFSDQVLQSYFPWRNAWDGSYALGIATATASPSYPLWSVVGLIDRLGGGFPLAERVVWLWPLMALLVLAPYAFVYRMTRQPWAAAFGAMLFAINTWTVALVQRGHFGSLISYALMPVVAIAADAWLRRLDVRSSVLLAGMLSLQILYDLRYAYIMLIACALMFVQHAIRRAMRRTPPRIGAATRAAAWTGLALLVFNAYWVLPQLLSPAQLPAGYDTLTYLFWASKFESVAHSVALFTPFYHYVQGGDPFGVAPVEPAFFAIPALAALSLILVRRKPYALAIAVAGAVGIIVTSGPLSPFGPIVTWAFVHVPGMTLFRDISKFTSVVAFAYAAAIGFGFARGSAIARRTLGSSRAWIAPVTAFAACLAYVALMRDAYDPARFATFSATTLSPDDVAVQRFLDDQPGSFRTFVFPTWRPEIVGTEAHPLVPGDFLLQAAEQDGGVRSLFGYFALPFERLSSPLVPGLLAAAGVRFVVVDADPHHSLYTPGEYDVQGADAEYEESVDFFAAQTWLIPVARFGGYRVYRLRESPAPAAFVARRPVRYVGGPLSMAGFAGSPWWAESPSIVTGASAGTAVAGLPRFTDRVRDPNADGWAFAPHALGEPAATPPPDEVGGYFHASAGKPVGIWMSGEPALGGRRVAWSPFTRAAEVTRVPPSRAPKLDQPIQGLVLADASLLSAPVPDVAGARWFASRSPRLVLDIVDPFDAPATADLKLRFASPDARGRSIRVRIAGRLASAILPPMSASHRPVFRLIEISDLALLPGDTPLEVDTSSVVGGAVGGAAYAVLVRGDGAASIRVGHDDFTLPAMKADVEAVTDGVRITARPVSAGTGIASFRILRGAPIPLEDDPQIDLRYRLPRTTLAYSIVATLADRHGHRATVEMPLSWARTESTFDVRDPVAAALFAAGKAPDAPESSDFALADITISIVGAPSLGAPDSIDLLDASVVDRSRYVGQPPLVASRSLDLRAASLTPAVEGSRVTRRWFSSPLPADRSSLRLRLPIKAADRATTLEFHAVVPQGVEPKITLEFSRGGDEVAVEAAGRPSLTDPDFPIPEDWVTDVSSGDGDGSLWSRYDIDLPMVEAYRLPRRGEGYALQGLDLEFSPAAGRQEDRESRVVVADPTIFRPMDAAPIASGVSVAMDTQNVLTSTWTPDPNAREFSAHLVAAGLAPGTHRALALPETERVTGMLVTAVPPPHGGAAAVDTISEPSPVERTFVKLDAGGLLVVPIAYAQGWRLAVNADGGPPLTGIALIDLARMRERLLPESDHVTVDDIFNGWMVPPGPARIDLIYAPAALSEAFAPLWLIGSTLLVVFARRRP